MSDNEGIKAGKGWTDRQRVRLPSPPPTTNILTILQLAYFFNLVEFSNVKLDYTVRTSISSFHAYLL